MSYLWHTLLSMHRWESAAAAAAAESAAASCGSSHGRIWKWRTPGNLPTPEFRNRQQIALAHTKGSAIRPAICNK